MPVYTYRCEKGHEFERTHSITDSVIFKCPIYRAASSRLCGKPCKRLISEGTSFALKGGGWADDGYA